MSSTILCGPASPGTIKVGIYLPVHTENNLRNEFSFKIFFSFACTANCNSINHDILLLYSKPKD